ncbi:hypothetical protein HMPREF9406_1319 [Clostridium sp. HGF2]|nr:hypothetical protein HMPREF9406_1319 [Clostridium sp. HGF2]
MMQYRKNHPLNPVHVQKQCISFLIAIHYGAGRKRVQG